MKKPSKKLSVTTQTVRDLTTPDAAQVQGGTLYYMELDPKVVQARPRCTAGYSGCTQSGR